MDPLLMEQDRGGDAASTLPVTAVSPQGHVRLEGGRKPFYQASRHHCGKQPCSGWWRRNEE